MKTKILLLIVIISFLSSCTDDKNVKEINTELKSEKIEIYSINIDSAKFENNTKYLKEYANQSNKYLEKSTQILKENLEKNIINLGEKYIVDKQVILDSNDQNKSNQLLRLENALMTNEKSIYDKYQKDLYAIEVEYSQKIEKEVKNTDDKNFEIYKSEYESLIMPE